MSGLGWAEAYEFSVEGIPVPQGSKRVFMVKGKPVMADVKSAALKKWRESVAAAAREIAPAEPLDCAVEVRVEFALVRPASVSRRYPHVAPDVDKLARAVLDALTASQLFRDDSRVVRLVASKVYASHPGARVSVGVLVDEEE